MEPLRSFKAFDFYHQRLTEINSYDRWPSRRYKYPFFDHDTMIQEFNENVYQIDVEDACCIYNQTVTDHSYPGDLNML